MKPKALIVDWGGVLTSPLAAALDGWYAAEGIDAAGYEAAIRDFHDEGLAALSVFDPIAALERGELRVEHFEQGLADRLTRFCGVPVAAEGLIKRMFAGFCAAPAMINVVREAKRAGLRTALLSNSWGNEYLRDDWDQLFDATVISGEVALLYKAAALTTAALSRPTAQIIITFARMEVWPNSRFRVFLRDCR